MQNMLEKARVKEQFFSSVAQNEMLDAFTSDTKYMFSEQNVCSFQDGSWLDNPSDRHPAAPTEYWY
jgi:hypothetical protein